MTTVTARDVLDTYTDTERDAIKQWVRDHGLEPGHVWSMTTLGPLILARVYVVDEQSRKQCDRRWRDRARMKRRWLWRKTPMPGRERP